MSSGIGPYVGRRLIAALGVLLVVSAITFLFIHLAPGGPEESLAGRFATPQQVAAIRAHYGLDDSLIVQYWRFLKGAVQFDFGTSLLTREPVGQAIGHRLDVTVPLLLVSFLLTVTIGMVLGVIASYRRDGFLDRSVMNLALVGASAPAFAVALVLLYVFGAKLGWLPVSGEGVGFAERVEHLILPIATLTIGGVAAMLKITRTRVGEVLQEDHVTFARARGLRPAVILRRSVLRNAGIQILTQVGAILLAMLGGTILVEVTFGLNGVGALLVEAISARDIPLVQAVTLLIAVVIVGVNLIVDLAYLALDPRVRLSGVGARA
jgi:peptide/nickel transport system permease protein